MKTYSGIHVPLITPFAGNDIDWESMKRLIEFYVEAGVSSVIPGGSTGECSTLSHDEHRKLIAFTVDAVDGRVPVIAGTGSNNTKEAISLTQYAESVGAKGALVVSPYYNRPSQQGIYQYFLEVAASTNIDILIYNIPSRTGCHVLLNTIKALAEIPNIKGIKDGAGDIQQMTDLAYHFLDSDFSVLTGEDTLLFCNCALGGDGGIMAAACLCPSLLLEMFAAVKVGHLEEARVIDLRVRPLVKALFLEVNPVVVKFAISEYFKIPYTLRKPLLPLGKDSQTAMLKALAEATLPAYDI